MMKNAYMLTTSGPQMACPLIQRASTATEALRRMQATQRTFGGCQISVVNAQGVAISTEQLERLADSEQRTWKGV